MAGTVNVGVLEAVLRLKNEFGGQIQQANQQLGDFKSRLTGVGTALAANISAQAITGEVKAIVGELGQIADAADKIGISAEAVQRLGFAASQGGSSIQVVGSAIGIMAKNLATEKADEKLNAIGLSLDAIKGLSPDQTFIAIAEKIREIPDPLQQSAAAMAMFGRGGAELLPAIKAGIEQVAATAPVMSNATVAAGDAAGDSFEKMQAKINALKADALSPLLNLFSSMPQSVQIGAVALSSLLPVITSIAPAIMAAGGPVAAFGMLSGAFTAILPFLGPVGLIAAGVVAVIAVWKYWDEITAFVQGVYNSVKTWLVDGLSAMWEAVKSGVKSTVDFIGQLLSIGGPLLGPVGMVLTIWKNWDRITEIAQNVYTGVKTWLLDKFAAVINSIKSKVEAVTGFFANMYDAVVGHSFVPDMITGIADEFAKLDAVMVQPASEATSKAGALFQSLSGSASGAMSSLFSGDFKGAVGGAVDAVEGFAMKGVKAVVGMIPVVGPFLQQFAGPIMGGLKKIGAIGIDVFKKLLGGPSKEELEGRDVAETFRAQVRSMLTDAQKVATGNDMWAQTVVGIRDAYIAAGHTEKEALDAADRLWKAEKQGGNAVNDVIREIEANMRGPLTDAVETATDIATTGFETWAEASKDVNLALAESEKLMISIAKQTELNRDGRNDRVISSTSSPDFHGTVEQFRALHPGVFEEWARNNPGDEGRFADAFQIKGFATGTPNLDFMNFGRKSLVELHGEEAVVPKGREAEFASRHLNMSGVEERLDRLEHTLISVLPRAIRDAQQLSQ